MWSKNVKIKKSILKTLIKEEVRKMLAENCGCNCNECSERGDHLMSECNCSCDSMNEIYVKNEE